MHLASQHRPDTQGKGYHSQRARSHKVKSNSQLLAARRAPAARTDGASLPLDVPLGTSTAGTKLRESLLRLINETTLTLLGPSLTARYFLERTAVFKLDVAVIILDDSVHVAAAASPSEDSRASLGVLAHDGFDVLGSARLIGLPFGHIALTAAASCVDRGFEVGRGKTVAVSTDRL